MVVVRQVKKSVRERRIPYDFTYMRNLKKNINKQNGNGLIDTENGLMAARWDGVGGLGVKGEGIEKYRLVITEQS